MSKYALNVITNTAMDTQVARQIRNGIRKYHLEQTSPKVYNNPKIKYKNKREYITIYLIAVKSPCADGHFNPAVNPAIE